MIPKNFLLLHRNSYLICEQSQNFSKVKYGLSSPVSFSRMRTVASLGGLALFISFTQICYTMQQSNKKSTPAAAISSRRVSSNATANSNSIKTNPFIKLPKSMDLSEPFSTYEVTVSHSIEFLTDSQQTIQRSSYATIHEIFNGEIEATIEINAYDIIAFEKAIRKAKAAIFKLNS